MSTILVGPIVNGIVWKFITKNSPKKEKKDAYFTLRYVCSRKDVTSFDLVNILSRNQRTNQSRINFFSESEGRVWRGRPAFTDTSDLVQINLMGVSLMREISTSVIQGDRDSQGRAFSQLTTAFR